MEHNLKDTKQLVIEIPAEIHTEIKLKATLRNISMKAWVLRLISREIAREKQYE